MAKKRKMAVIQMRARKADVALIDRAAKIVGTSRSALIRQAAEAHARRVLSLVDGHKQDLARDLARKELRAQGHASGALEQSVNTKEV